MIDFPDTTQAGKLLPHERQMVSYSLTKSLQVLPGHLIFSPGVSLGGCLVKMLTAMSVYLSLSSGFPMPYNFTKALEHSL